MIVYVTSFIISVLLIFISNKLENKKLLKIVFTLFALMIPCVVAGLRDYTIGTDVQWYLKPLFNCAHGATSFQRFNNMIWWNPNTWRYFTVSEYEILFRAIVFGIVKIFDSLQWLMFFVEVGIILPVYFGIKRIKKLHGLEWLSMLIFYLLFYNVTLNLMRQFIGLSILFYGSCCLLGEQNKTKYWICFIISFLFHSSMAIGIIIPIIYYLLSKKENKIKYFVYKDKKISVQKLVLIIILILSTVFFINIGNIKTLLLYLHFDKYVGYIDGSFKFSVYGLLRNLPILLLFIRFYKTFSEKEDNSLMYILLFLIDAIFIVQLASIWTQSVRIGYIFKIFNIISLPLLIRCLNRRQKVFYSLALLMFLSALWYYDFVIVGSCETVPYLVFRRS